MPMGLEIYLISSLISNTFQFPKSFLEPTEKYEEPKFFDNVPQDKLMTLVGKLIHDPDTESLISKYLRAGAMVRGQY